MSFNGSTFNGRIISSNKIKDRINFDSVFFMFYRSLLVAEWRVGDSLGISNGGTKPKTIKSCDNAFVTNIVLLLPLRFRVFIASYIDHFRSIRLKGEMSTKQHFIVVREKMNKRTFQDLERTERILSKKLQEISNSLRSTFEAYDLTIRKLSEKDTLTLLYRLFDFEMSKLYC